MQGKDVRTMEPFADRLKRACAYARIDYSATEVGRNLGLAKQTVHRWMSGSAMPSPEYIFLIADSWRINPRWLATGEGSMLTMDPAENLTKQELDLIAAYRSAQQDGKSTMRAVAKAVGKSALAVMMGVSLNQPPAEAGDISHNYFSQYTMTNNILKRIIMFVRGFFRIAKLTAT